jgi:hypothetical protein
MPKRLARLAIWPVRPASRAADWPTLSHSGLEARGLTWASSALSSWAKLLPVAAAVGFVGGEEVGHDALKLERRLGVETRQNGERVRRARRPGGSCRYRSRGERADEPASAPRHAAAIPSSSSCQGSQTTAVRECRTTSAPGRERRRP